MFFLDSLNAKFARYLSFPIYAARGMAEDLISMQHHGAWIAAHLIQMRVAHGEFTVPINLYYVESSTEDYMEKWSRSANSMQNCACYAYAMHENILQRGCFIEDAVSYFSIKNRPESIDMFTPYFSGARMFCFRFNPVRSSNERITNYYMTNSIWIRNNFSADNEFVSADLFICLCNCAQSKCINCITLEKNTSRGDKMHEFYLNNSLRADFYDGNVFEHMIKKLRH